MCNQTRASTAIRMTDDAGGIRSSEVCVAGAGPGRHSEIRLGSTLGTQSTTDERPHMKTKKQKRAIEQSSAKQKELEKRLSTLRGQLTKTEKKLTKATERAERWKTEAQAQKKSAARAGTRAEKLHHKLDRASAALEPAQASTPIEAAVSGRPVAEPTTDGVTLPDETWSVVQLRAEARARGLVGMSNKPKAQLLAALS